MRRIVSWMNPERVRAGMRWGRCQQAGPDRPIEGRERGCLARLLGDAKLLSLVALAAP